MMESLRVFLPSNASMDVFPNNKPSDFKIELNPPLHLEGEWEVGVENVCYHSAIANLEEMERITLMARTYAPLSMNEVFDYSYVLTKDGKWNYDWIQLESSYYGDIDALKIIDTLNSGNDLIMKNQKKKVYQFHFTHSRNKIWYAFKSYSSGFALRLNDDLLLHLGFGHAGHVFNTDTADKTKVDKTNLIQKTNYQIKMFDASVVACEERIILKARDEDALSLTALVKRWNDTVGEKYGELATDKNDTFTLNKKNNKLVLFFSTSLRHIVRFYSPIIGNGTFSGVAPYVFSKEASKDEWYVDVYGDRIKTLRQHEKEFKPVMDIPVRQYSTVHELIRKANPFMVNFLKVVLKDKYDEKQHHVSFSIRNQRTILKLGSEVKLHLTKHFATLFGFPYQTFTEPRTLSVESPMTLDKREQHLYIQSDLIEPVSFGDRKEYIMRDFIHDKDGSYGIMEKMFEPILYHPVVKQSIPTISLRITNGLRETIHLRDTKTLVTLIFRKAK